MAQTKFDEAKAALERGAFEEALHLSEAAQSERPEDPQARELYAVTHLAKAIRLSEKAREARRTDLFRRDRGPGRPAALAILQELAAADPANKQVPFTIRKIERPCERCDDTGFCPHCKGRGLRRTLGFERKCERCYGRGICPACGVL